MSSTGYPTQKYILLHAITVYRLPFLRQRLLVICESAIAGKVYSYGFYLSPASWTWGSSPKSQAFGSFLGDQVVGNKGGDSHSSTIEKLYAWEKKLYEEVKVEIYLRFFHFFFFHKS